MGGGVWKSTDAGASWTALDDFMASIAVGCLTIDPANPQTLYCGAGKADIGYIVPPSGGQNAVYSILKSSTGYSFLPGDVLFVVAGFPVLGDTPVVGDFDGDGKDDPGIWRESQGVWILPRSSSNYATYIFSQWGQSGDIAIPNTSGRH